MRVTKTNVISIIFRDNSGGITFGDFMGEF